MDTYTQAQKDALKLLQIVNTVCEENHIVYSLSGGSLIWQHYGYDFDKLNPNGLSVCLKYGDYVKLIRLLEDVSGPLGISVIHHKNRSDFDSLSAWVYKTQKKLLSEDRKNDEIFYQTHLSIKPIFSVGDSDHAYKKMEKEIYRTFRLLNTRAPLPHKRWFSGIKGKMKRTKARFYRLQRQKEKPSVQKLEDYLAAHEKEGRYLILRNDSGQVVKLFSEELQVKKAKFLSVDTYVFQKAQEMIDRNYPGQKEPEKKASDLLLRGGLDLRRVQLIQLDMMLEIDRICRKYDLKYNIAFGTLLGAVRHKGFVPWDDDADINMPYEDYQKLAQVIEKELDAEKYYFRIQEKEADCNITYAHLKRNGTIYTKPDRDGFRYHPGVFIDIVPIFNGAPNLFFHSVQTRICWFFRTACWAHMGAGGEKKFFKRQYYKLIAKIGNKRAYGLFIKFATMWKRKRNKMLFLNGMDRSPYNIAFVKRECYDSPVELEFEGHLFYAPADYERVLEYCYGKDYMMYPPLKKRNPKNNAKIELGGIYEEGKIL